MNTPEQIQAQRELEADVLAYVRGLQAMAPVNEEAIHGWLTRVRGRRVTAAELRDRIADLVDRGYLAESREWKAGVGPQSYYRVSARARAALDGAEPWDWESRK
jgi:hypothetical protein